jgi:tetratricopeptide (TPR) repeat protein
MPARNWIILLSVWPGLAQIWSGQEVLGLFLAAMFALAANLAILARFVWTEAFPPGSVLFLVALAAGAWLATLAYTAWWTLRCHPERHREEIDALHRSALELYLQRRWNEARGACERIVAMDENDADALMQLGRIHQRSGRLDHAREAFRQCLDLKAGQKWRWEIQEALAASTS